MESETPPGSLVHQLPWSEFSSSMKKTGWFVTVRRRSDAVEATVSFPPQKNSTGVNIERPGAGIAAGP